MSRIAGADRFETSSALSAAVFGHAGSAGGEHPRVYVASGQTFPDALSGSAAAGLAGGPVLLVENDTVPVSVATELGRLAPSEIVVLGGRNAISDAVARQLTKLAPTVRVDGTDRFAVSAAISTRSFPSGARTVYVASGAAFPDALSGSAAAVQEGSPVLLVLPDRIPTAVAAELDRLNPRRIVLLGGPAAVDDRVFSGLQVYLTP